MEKVSPERNWSGFFQTPLRMQRGLGAWRRPLHRLYRTQHISQRQPSACELTADVVYGRNDM